jgi:hypothetical protein
VFGNDIETQIFAMAAPLDIRCVDPSTTTQRRDYASAAGHGDVSSTVSAVAWDEALVVAQILASVSVWE